MNHTSTVNSVANQVAVLKALSPKYNLPFILGETNSLYNQGRPGLSNTFGAALWVLDFNLYCASQNIKRTHMHMGTNYRYASWQPVSTFITSIGTKAPYYGNMAVAATLGNLKAANVSIANIEMANDTSAAYGIYENNVLKRVSFINMQSYNYSVPNPIERPTQPYQILLTGYEGRTANILRLWANGSDAVTGITWDGWSYNYELDEGRPVKLNNVTTGEKVTIGDGGVLEVDVPWSSAALVSFPPEQF